LKAKNEVINIPVDEGGWTFFGAAKAQVAKDSNTARAILFLM
jgi:hypothetical protein